MKNKASVAGLNCSTAATTPSSCNFHCCENDNTKCRGISGGTCPSDKYRDPTKYGNAATSANFATNCCTVKQTCAEWVGSHTTEQTATTATLLTTMLTTTDPTTTATGSSVSFAFHPKPFGAFASVVALT